MQKKHRRYFKIADITVQVESDLPISDTTFLPKFRLFEVNGPGEDTVVVRHYLSLPDLSGKDLGIELYRRPPWVIYKKDGLWIYLCIPAKHTEFNRVAIFNHNYTRAKIYNDAYVEKLFRVGNRHSITLLPNDQILLARLLADRQGCYIHSCGVNLEGKGLLFVGRSGAGKSTMANMLKGKAEILCDDRIIIRRHGAEFRIYGTWSHGDVPDVSANSVPLNAIMFLEKAEENRLIRLDDKKEITKRLLSCVIRPFATTDWWEKTLFLIDKISNQIPCHLLKFDKSTKAEDILKEYTGEGAR